jgi:SAM-dependent methyltransferase
VQVDGKYDHYRTHFARIGKRIPDWTKAQGTPENYALHEPWLPGNRNARVLDFGCGYGHQLMALWCSGYRQLEGVEQVPELAQAANEAAEGRVKIYCMDGEEFLADKEATYHVICLFAVLEHIPVTDGVRLLRKINRALVQGGRVVLRVPNMSSLLAGHLRYADLTHAAGYTELSIQQVLDQAGFENHVFMPDVMGWNPSSWRPWVPWRGLGLHGILNISLHRVVYWVGGVTTRPSRFDEELYLYSHKGGEKAETMRTLGRLSIEASG